MEVRKFIIAPDVSIREAIRQLDQTARKILVVEENNKLAGVLTDGDIRRWILKNKDISMPVRLIMNTAPVVIKKEKSHLALEIMKEKQIEGLPLVNDNNEVTDILFWNELNDHNPGCQKKTQTPAVIMAGGRGSRLYPYTKIIPKPLIPIGDTPIVERIMNQMMEYGFYEFYLTINYKKELIKAYFNDDHRYHLHLIEEADPLGTAGSLNLVKKNIKGSFLVSNCDILVDVNYTKLLIYHNTHKNKITVVTAMKSYEIPYGVVTLGENGSVDALNEKPRYELLVSTGLYVLEEEILKYIPQDQYFDMTDLIRKCLKNGEQVGAYPVMDSAWLDMGEFSEMKKMAERMKL
ncbi:nucleotidyltransferase family protein [Lacrimispora sphenoides]|uniref:CBS domain-containing protein n=1 Tax=Lacrimispora sphenoides JCM 1415 TaxID=1297793 RepID=A0ABY1CB28_9FIRM|nr:nucleotidyltransferase family protein [Lacrimispora sphenoides]SET86563.1 CBS domain-containing protein [[Clostridium] sphenoides JCM 1415]SUY51886.1 nucleotidyltransferase [Lacrimispora sphenoides]